MIYADHNATTPLCENARKGLEQAYDHWGNPSSTHALGRKATEALENAREKVAAAVGVSSKNVVFTSGGAEANSLAILGFALSHPGIRILTTQVEHSSVKGASERAKAQGAEVRFVPVAPTGALDMVQFQEELASFKPHLVSVMVANNETGVIFPIPAISELCRRAGALFHSDAVQALGKIPTAHWNRADFISISAHKIYGPKGVGALIVGSNAKLVPLNYGGSQELKRRGGTQATPAIFGFAGACEELSSPEDLCALAGLRDRFEHLLETELTDLSIQGKGEPRIPNTSNIRFTGVSAEALLGALDLEGIHVSTGSACSSGSVLPSPVLMAMGLNESEAKECLRISWGRSTISSDIDTAAEAVVRHVQRIRARKPRSI